MLRAFVRLSEICQIVFLTFTKKFFCTRCGDPGPLVSSRAEAEAVFASLLPPSLFPSFHLLCAHLLRRRCPGSSRAEAEAIFSLPFSLPGAFPHKLTRRPGAPSPRRRPSLVNSGRRRGGGDPGPLVSSRAEAEVLSPLPSLLFSAPLFPSRCVSHRLPRRPGKLPTRGRGCLRFPLSVSSSLCSPSPEKFCALFLSFVAHPEEMPAGTPALPVGLPYV